MGVGTTVFVYHLHRAFTARKGVCDDKRSAHFECGRGGIVSVLHNLGRGGTGTRPGRTRRMQGDTPGRVRGVAVERVR
jgi:hypothetical protein